MFALCSQFVGSECSHQKVEAPLDESGLRAASSAGNRRLAIREAIKLVDSRFGFLNWLLARFPRVCELNEHMLIEFFQCRTDMRRDRPLFEQIDDCKTDGVYFLN